MSQICNHRGHEENEIDAKREREREKQEAGEGEGADEDEDEHVSALDCSDQMYQHNSSLIRFDISDMP